jgi:hypothetical protein
MPRQTLKTASKSRAKSSAKKVASKIADTPKADKAKTSSNGSITPKTPSTITSPVSGTVVNSSGSNSAISVPGLVSIAPDQIAGMLPSFNADSYKITDPLKPSESLPQVSEADFEKGTNIYQGTQRALKLTGSAFDTARERFITITKQAKAFGSGVQAATEFERVRGNYFDYLNQLEANEQKAIALDISQVKNTTDRSKSVHVKVEMGERLKQSEIAAEKAQEETKQKQSQLDEFRKQLGQYAKAS